MWSLLRVLKDLAFSDQNKNEEEPGPLPPPDEQRSDGRHRGGMTQAQFFTELEKLTEL